jgi:DNA-directed RNA polymerase specialized sigma24 family protein
MATRDTIRPLIAPASHQYTDADLYRDAENGNAAAFQQIAARYDHAILSLLLALSGSEQVALDLCHSTLLTAYRHLQRRRKQSLYICFYRLAVNHWLAWVANHAALPARGESDALCSLSARERLVFTLKTHPRLGLETVAQILDLPRPTVARIFTRAVDKLRLTCPQH